MESGENEWDKSPLPFLHSLQELKHLPRTGWLRTVDNPESVASHSFRLAFLGLFAPSGLDKAKCLFIGLCHDLAETVVGDIPTYAGVPKERKHVLEHLGFRYITSLVRPCDAKLADDIMATWMEYEEGTTAEARWMREMDKFECLVQAFEYEQRTNGAKGLEEFQGLCSKISSPKGKAWLEILQQERSAHLLKRTQRLPVIFVIGDLGVCETQCALLCKDFGFQCISMEQIIEEKSRDRSCRDAELLRDCLMEKVDVPVSLASSLLETKIRDGMDGKRWTLVYGFPTAKEQILDFERKVQKPNYVVIFRQTCKSNTESLIYNTQMEDLKRYLRSMKEHCIELDFGNDLAVYRKLKEAVEECIKQSNK